MNMRRLEDLPSAPDGRKGWPWDEAIEMLPSIKDNGQPWPRITVVTPSFNQGQYLEETIRSVLLQGYPNLEYIIMDGGSTDDSVAVMQKYDAWIDHWESKPDQGQAHAINKGFNQANGDLIHWINSDDFLQKGALEAVGYAYQGLDSEILVGDVEDWYPDEDRVVSVCQKALTFEHLLQPTADWSWHQQGTFVPKKLYQTEDHLNEDLRYAFDLDWIFRLLRKATICYVPACLASFRLYGDSKTGAEFGGMLIEVMDVKRRYLSESKSVPKQDLLAWYHFHMASVYLVKHVAFEPHKNRYKGLLHLASSVLRSPKIFLNLDFLKLCFRGMMPRLFWRSSRVQATLTTSRQGECMAVLDLGCGFNKQSGAIGVDRLMTPAVDIVADLDQLPYPLNDNSFDKIHCQDVMEHLDDVIGTMEEIWRIGKPGADIYIHAPSMSSPDLHTDPTHCRAFTSRSFDYFVEGEKLFRYGYSQVRFEKVSVAYDEEGRDNKRFYDRWIAVFATHYPLLYERRFAYVLQLQGISFHLRVVKDR